MTDERMAGQRTDPGAVIPPPAKAAPSPPLPSRGANPGQQPIRADWQAQEIRRLLGALEGMGVKVDAVLPDGTHLYWCTAHRCSGSPAHCEGSTRLDGAPKIPACCKWCQAPCRHSDTKETPE